jgi:hypothetical protein
MASSKGVSVLAARKVGSSRKSKETKFGPKKGSTPPGNKSNKLKVR